MGGPDGSAEVRIDQVIEVVDALGRVVRIPHPARRIVSLVPSVTETLFSLGSGAAVVGCTTWCVHPEAGVRSVTKVGGTKNPDVEAILRLAPDLVLANKEENRKEDVEALAAALPVHVSYPRDLMTVVRDLADLGVMVGATTQASTLIAKILHERDRFQSTSRPRVRVAYFIWRKPWMVAAGDTFIDSMLSETGFENAFHELPGRYPEISIEDLHAHGVEAVLLSSEPFPFDSTHVAEVAAATGILSSRIIPVSGEAFSWFGTRTATLFDEAVRIHGQIAARS